MNYPIHWQTLWFLWTLFVAGLFFAVGWWTRKAWRKDNDA